MSLVHWLVVAVLVILLFGGSRFSNMMGDVAKGLKNFKKGMAEDDEAKPVLSKAEGSAPPSRIEVTKTVEPERDPRPVEVDRR